MANRVTRGSTGGNERLLVGVAYRADGLAPKRIAVGHAIGDAVKAIIEDELEKVKSDRCPMAHSCRAAEAEVVTDDDYSTPVLHCDRGDSTCDGLMLDATQQVEVKVDIVVSAVSYAAQKTTDRLKVSSPTEG